MLDATEQAWERGGNGGTIPPAAHRFRPGVSGNPGGRPRTRRVSVALRRILAGPPGGAERALALESSSEAERLAASLIVAAVAGDVQAAKVILDRVEGRVEHRQAVGAESGPAVVIQVLDAERPRP